MIMTRILLTFLMMIFMTLGPVASLSAQIYHTHNPQKASQQITTDQNTSSSEDLKTVTDRTKHSCCQDNCDCSFQNQCDIQHLTFFAIPLHSYTSPRFIKTSVSSFYTTGHIFISLDSIDRPPIFSV